MTTSDLRRLLHERVGPIQWAQFSLVAEGHLVPFTALTRAGEVVDGRLVLHAVVAENHVTVSAEVELGPEPQIRTAADGSKDRLEIIARRARAIIRRVREEPTYGPSEIVAALVSIVDIADGDVYPV